MGKQSEQGYQKNIHEKGQLKSELFGEERNRDSSSCLFIYFLTKAKSEREIVCWRRWVPPLVICEWRRVNGDRENMYGPRFTSHRPRVVTLDVVTVHPLPYFFVHAITKKFTFTLLLYCKLYCNLKFMDRKYLLIINYTVILNLYIEILRIFFIF